MGDALVEEDTQQLNEEIEDSASKFRDLESKDKDKDIAQPRQALFNLWGSSSSDLDEEDVKDGEDDKDSEDDKDGEDGEDDDCHRLNIICHGQKVKGKISGALGKAKNIAGKIADAFDSSFMSNNTTTPQ